MDYSRGRWRFLTRMNRPSARLFFACSEKRTQTEQMIDGANKRMNPAVLQAEVAQVFHRLIFAKIDKFTFNLGADDDRFRCKMMLRIILYRAYAIRRAIADLARGNRREIRFRHIASENRWLRCEQKKSMRERFFLGAQFCGDGGFSRVEMQQKRFDDLVFDFCGFRSGAHLLL